MEKKDKIRLLSQLAVITAVISIFIAVLLLLNYWNTKKTDPLESKAMIALIERLRQEPGNEELKLEIRNLDLLARKAYFTGRWQVRTGGFILLFSSILLGVILKILYDLRKKIELPEDAAEKGMIERALSRRWIGIVSGLVIGGALIASFTSRDYLEQYLSAPVAADASVETYEKIQVIEVTVAETDEDIADIQKDSIEPAVEASAAQAEPAAAAEITGSETAVKTKVAYPGLDDLRKQHNSFRGPLGQGISYHKNIPVDWDGPGSKNIIWKSEVPKPGNNSPVIWNERIFVAGADAESRWIYCYDRNNGNLLWEHQAKDIAGSPATPPKTTPDTGLSAPTLTTDGSRVYAIFATGDILALDFEGKRVWAKNLGVPDNHYGHSSSLIYWAGRLVVQYDTNRSGRVMVLDGLTGDIIWDVPRDVQVSWASPVLAEIEGKYQVLLTSAPLVAGYDFESGRELWTVDCLMGEVGPSVGFADGLVYASNEYATMAAIKPGSGNAEIIWEQDEYLPEASSPVVAGGLLFLGTSYGVFACYDAKTGENYWEYECGSGFYGSPIAADGKIYVVDMAGVAHIFELSKKLKVIAEPVLGEKSVVTPAFADGRIYLRGSKFLYCIGG